MVYIFVRYQQYIYIYIYSLFLLNVLLECYNFKKYIYKNIYLKDKNFRVNERKSFAERVFKRQYFIIYITYEVYNIKLFIKMLTSRLHLHLVK